MKKSPRASKTPFIHSQKLRRQLNAYALAASAAGVSVLALTQSSQAKVIYTKTHQVIGQNGTYNLDLNHDGVVDFLIQESSTGAFQISNRLLAEEAVGNAVEGSKLRSSYNLAAALKRGAPVGPRQHFVAGQANGEAMVSYVHPTTSFTYVRGHWANVSSRYLGLKFRINGKIHYGWARLSVQQQQFHITATLTGYAFETIPNKGIVAGQTNDDANAAQVSFGSVSLRGSGPTVSVGKPLAESTQVGSLSVLALGAEGGPQGRRP
jgi:hypothetical protein